MVGKRRSEPSSSFARRTCTRTGPIIEKLKLLTQTLGSTISQYAEYRIIVVQNESTPDLFDAIDIELDIVIDEIATDASICGDEVGTETIIKTCAMSE